MSISIQTVVIHEIKKREGQTTASTFLIDEALDSSNAQIIRLVSTLDDSFLGKTLRRAKFSDDGFKNTITDFNHISLVESSQKLTEKLKDGIQNISAAKGGYLVFSRYRRIRNYLSVFLVRNTEGSHLMTKNQTWDIQSIMYLDIKNFAMGVRINLDHLISAPDDNRYIQLVRGSTDIPDYFENWVGLEDKKQEVKDGEALYELANKIELPTGISSRDNLKKQIFDYVNGRSSKVVNLQELSAYLYEGDAEKIPNYCEENQLDIDGEFKLKGTQLNKFYKILISAGGIKLEAPRSSFSESEIHVSNNGKTVLIHSQELAEKIRQEVQ